MAFCEVVRGLIIDKFTRRDFTVGESIVSEADEPWIGRPVKQCIAADRFSRWARSTLAIRCFHACGPSRGR